MYVDGKFTEDREEWQKELPRHCEGVFTDPDETREVHEKRIEYFKKKGDRHFTDGGRGAEITVDLVLQARVKMCENKVKRAGMTEAPRKLRVGGIEGISCQHFPSHDDKFVAETLGVAGGQKTNAEAR